MLRTLLPLLLAMLPDRPALDIPALPIGRGTVIVHDCGYWNAPKEQGGKWVELKMRLVLVGVSDGELSKATGGRHLVFIIEGRSWAGNAHLLRRDQVKRIVDYRPDDGLPYISISDIEVSVQR